MKLADLKPKLTDTALAFTCPACGEHRIVIPVDRTGPGPCRWHGFITDGETSTC